MNESWYRWRDNVLLLDCVLKPQARSNKILGLRNGRLHVQIKAAPVDGKANTALCHFLAKAFGTSIQKTELIRGATARNKTIALNQPGQEPAWFRELTRQSPELH